MPEWLVQQAAKPTIQDSNLIKFFSNALLMTSTQVSKTHMTNTIFMIQYVKEKRFG